MRTSHIWPVIALLSLLWPAVAALAQDIWVTTPDGTLSIPLYRQPEGGLSIRPPQARVPPATNPQAELLDRGATAYCSEVALAAGNSTELERLKKQWGDGWKVDMQQELRECARYGFTSANIKAACANLLTSEQDGSLYSAIERGFLDPETAKAAMRECRWLMTGSGPDPYADLRPPAQ